MVLWTGATELEFVDPGNTFTDIFVKSWSSVNGRAAAVVNTDMLDTISADTRVIFRKLPFAGCAKAVWLELTSTILSFESVTVEVVGVPANKNENKNDSYRKQ